MPPTVLPAHTLDRAGPGETATGYHRGDFVLVAGTHFGSRVIRFGQKLRIRGPARIHVHWTHAALIVDEGGGLIEAVGRGVRRWHLDRYAGDDYVVVRLDISDDDRDQVVAFAESVLRRPYARLSTVSVGLSMLTGSRFSFFVDGQYFCSGLVAAALERAGHTFERNAVNVAPADLARFFRVDRFAPHHPASRPAA